VTTIELIPWIVNGVLLVLALIYRPEIGVGYIGFIGAILILAGTFAALVVVSCVVSIPIILISNQLGLIVWIVLMVISVIFFGIKLIGLMLSKL
jgi:hypothetical protein